MKHFQNLSLSSSSPATEKPPEKQLHKIRISLNSRFRKCLDEVAAAFISNARDMGLLMVWGLGTLPTQVVNITTTLTSSPQGYNLVRNSELQYHGRVVDVIGSTELVEQIISDFCGSGVDIEFKILI